MWTCSDRVRAAKALCRSGVDWPRRYLVCQDKVARHAPLGMRGTAGRGRATRPSAGRGTRGAGSEESNPQRTLMGRPRLTRQSLSRSLSLSRPPRPFLSIPTRRLPRNLPSNWARTRAARPARARPAGRHGRKARTGARVGPPLVGPPPHVTGIVLNRCCDTVRRCRSLLSLGTPVGPDIGVASPHCSNL